MSRVATCFALGVGVFAVAWGQIWARQTVDPEDEPALAANSTHLRFARLLNRSGEWAWLTDGHRPLSARVKPGSVSIYVPIPHGASLRVVTSDAAGPAALAEIDGVHATVLLEKDGKTVKLLLQDVPGPRSKPGPITTALAVGR